MLDLFAGPGGWDVGARGLGLDPLGVELDPDACATRVAAGLRTLRGDVAELDPAAFGPVDGLIGSPPCQAYSSAGRQAGRRDAERVERCLRGLADGVDLRAELRDELGEPEDGALFGFATEDTRSLLVVEPLRYALALHPRWVALEQVPPVLPLWEVMAELLREHGYRTWTGLLRADEFGVPQTRERAFMLAHVEHQPGRPAATHQRWRKGAEPVRPVDGAGLLPWVTIAEALGWGMTAHPSTTLASTSAGGPRPLDGGSGARATLAAEVEAGRWVEYDRRAGAVAQTAPRMHDEPAPSLTAKGLDGVHVWRLKGTNQVKATRRAPDEPAPTIAGGNLALPEWVAERPATTVAGDHRVHPPGHKQNASDPPGRYDGRAGANAIRVSIEEAAVLQGFPADYPWQGVQTAQFRQVGNAVPPPMARAVLAAVVNL